MNIHRITQRARDKLLSIFCEENISDPVVSISVSTLEVNNGERTLVEDGRISVGIYKRNDFSTEDVFEIDGIRFLVDEEANESLSSKPRVLDLGSNGDFIIRAEE